MDYINKKKKKRELPYKTRECRWKQVFKDPEECRIVFVDEHNACIDNQT